MRNIPEIRVDYFIDHFGVKDPLVKEVLHKYPPLCYLLGKVSPLVDATGQQVIDARPDNILRPVFYLTEGSGMFGLEDPQDAMRWKGIFNHSLGHARQVKYTWEQLRDMTPSQKASFEQKVFDFTEFDSLDIEEATKVIMTIHGGRRRFDERNWHNLADAVHSPKGTPGGITRQIYEDYKAPDIFLNLIRLETHADHLLQQIGETGLYLPNIVDASATYADWTFGQKTVSLEERFPQIDATRADLGSSLLAKLKSAGQYFETVYNEVFRTTLLEELKTLQPPKWETKIRRAYCAPSGLQLNEVFPNYPIAA